LPITDANSDEVKAKLSELAAFIGVPVESFSGWIGFNLHVATQSRDAYRALKTLKEDPESPYAGATYRLGIAAHNPQRGRRADAYFLAEEIARVFDLWGKPVTFGLASDQSGQPSTPYCVAVERGLLLFGLSSGWRQPARAAFDERRKSEA